MDRLNEFQGRAAMIHVLDLTDAWFEPGAGGARLMIALDHSDGAQEVWARIAGTPHALVLFRHVADIKGRRVFAATEWHRADDPARSAQDPSRQLAGPFRKGPTDVG